MTNCVTRAQRHAKESGRPLRALVEEGLRRIVLSDDTERRPYRLPDLSVETRPAAIPWSRTHGRTSAN